MSNTVIRWWTKSHFNHVAIDLGDGTKIEALSNGIVRTKYDSKQAATWSYAQNSKDNDSKDMAEAFAWLIKMVGTKYDWSDVATAGNLLNKFVYFVRHGYYDCSALAAEFLVKAGGVDLGELGLDPHLATPASLAAVPGVK